MTAPMRLLRTAAAALLLFAACGVARADLDAEALLRELGADSAHVRRRSRLRLEMADDVTSAAVVAALVAARAGDHPDAIPELLALAGARGFTAVGDVAVNIAQDEDPILAEAALRCLVMLGPDHARSGIAALGVARPDSGVATTTLSASIVGARRDRLQALAIQDAVELDLFQRWRRKGGTYEGRFALLKRHGWAAQPVLFAMLLDVPLEDRFLALPEDREPSLGERFIVLREILRSHRRGYRTFRQLPRDLNADDLFDLSAQALMDVADMDVLGDVLDAIAQTLENAHDRYRWNIGFQLRPWEDSYAEVLGEILAAHDRKERLARRAERIETAARDSRRIAMRVPKELRARALFSYARDLTDLAGVLHRMREFDRAAAVYAESIRVSTELGGEAPTIAAYNRACALARAGHVDDALKQLDVALQSDLTDLRRGWVEEDGDLRTLRDDARFQEILDRHFGRESGSASGAADTDSPAPAADGGGGTSGSQSGE